MTRVPAFSAAPAVAPSLALGAWRADPLLRARRSGATAARAPARAQLSVPAPAGRAAGANTGAGAPLWARAPVPVYSVGTLSAELGRGNLNVATYVTACGLGDAPRLAVALYVGTLTWVNVKQRGRARLSLLSEKHLPLVTLFGKASGRDIDKVAEALRMGFDVRCEEYGMPFVADGLGYVDVEVETWVDCGDHELAICSTKGSVELLETVREEGPDAVMTTGYLRKRGVLPAL